MNRKHGLAILFLAAVSAFSSSLLSGAAGIDLPVILHFRLPRTIAACIAGAALALAGTIFQGVLKNPLADPYLLGTSAGASAAAALCFLNGFGRGTPLFYIIVFIGAAGGTFLSYMIARFSGKISDASLILSGVAVSSFLTALLMLFMNLGGEKALALIGFVMGSFSAPSLAELLVSGLILLAVLAAAFACSRFLDAFSLGEEKAYHLGADPAKGRILFFALASAASAAAVSLCGTIGFVGLMVPHIMRLMFSPLARILVPASALGGAVLLCAADTAGRALFAPSEIPAGIIMSLCGAPFFLWLLFRKKASGRAFVFSESEVLQSQANERPASIAAVPSDNSCFLRNNKHNGNLPLLEIRNLSFAWDCGKASDKKGSLAAGLPKGMTGSRILSDCQKVLFRNLSFSLEAGDFLGILGPNGAGKSTLLKIISGFIKNDAGIYLEGIKRSALSPAELASKISWLPGELETPYDFKTSDFVELGCCAGTGFMSPATHNDRKRAIDALSAAGILGLSERSLNSLSSGERQLVFLAQALAQDSSVMLLDEPVSHLDLHYKSRFLEIVSSYIGSGKHCAIAVLHEPALAFSCTKVLLLGHDSFFIGNPGKAVSRDNLSVLYGIEKDSPLLRF